MRVISMNKNQKAHEFYEKNKEKIEEWLDLALYKPDTNAPIEQIPNKLDYFNNREFRRFCLIRHQLRLLELADLSASKKVLDIGAGFGDYAITADNFKFERMDATDPGIDQYKFLTEKFKYYDNVYNLGIEEMNMSAYDTIIWSHSTAPNIFDSIKNHILTCDNLKDVVLVINLLHSDDHLELDAENLGPTPWLYDRKVSRKLHSFKIVNMMFKSKRFSLKNSFARMCDLERKMTSRYYLHYQRD